MSALRGPSNVIKSRPAMNRLYWAWRSVFQAIAFALFGVGAWLLTLVCCPLVWLAPISRDRKTAIIQNVVHHFFRAFLGFIQITGVMVFHVDGADTLNSGGGGIVIANHPTLLDVVVLISRMPQADCIVKKELWGNVFMRWMVASAGYLPNDDGPGLMAAAIERVNKGRKVIIFPEGTRSLPGMMHPFSNGFAHIAVRAPCKVWPVLIRCVPPALRKGGGFFEVPDQRPVLTASAREPLNPADFYDRTDSAAIAVRKVAAATRRYFEENAPHVGS
jgi:1-acyl-sn-glycerol-3-phosphate acyltransferase